MKLSQLAGSGQTLAGQAGEIEIRGLTADSREVRAGFLFAALPGTKLDGMAFAADALRQGAAAILVPQGRAAELPPGMPVIEAADPRRTLALMAARFHGPQPRVAVAVTGTNGKTSVASFVRQIWAGLGIAAASLGTTGIASPRGERGLKHTTPDPVTLHKMLQELAGEGVTHFAMEASSHGLQQRRLDGIELTAGAFTNISRDHLDYHPTFEDYLAQKLRLFRELLPRAAGAVVDPDTPGGDAVLGAAKERGLTLFTVGKRGTALALKSAERSGFAQRLNVVHEGRAFDITLPLVGGFQCANALVAAGLCIAAGSDGADVLGQLETLKGATGRLELVGEKSGAPVFVDYAHTPDALDNALAALRPYVSGQLVAVFGCGGDRDRGKRPLMGQVATRKADTVIVTDDNPRS
ncbi:MAG: UDP-N-acetylmuramoyl-L-alanyl-D-glutamate--2,6-diaminopimelate ligase, partial [Pseudomonadota bacterium]|nr:UDP-N-acetylmuramoyl-L-alanyl-D-glutamate--2,6-diaminopimelate ligase [Pseudomonadota bacterium]